jgi:voltage-gated potassium channel
MKVAEYRLQVYLAILLSVIVIGVIGFIFLEGLSPLDALYFIIVTLATVGYGDITPYTQAGRILIIILILVGVGSFIAVAATGIEVMLDRRENANRLRKQNMIIGLFFKEIGTSLLRYTGIRDPDAAEIKQRLKISNEWTEKEFSAVYEFFSTYHFQIDRKLVDRSTLVELLEKKRDVLNQLMQNPILFEHDTFSDLLQAIFHLMEELEYRKEYPELPDNDLIHLNGDLERVYRLLAGQWLGYMKHLKNNYPYLFSLSMRTNPFDEKASPIFV